MNNYITLDGKKYKTNANDWEFRPMNPRTFRSTLSGSTDSTYGPVSLFAWAGSIVVPVTPIDAGWGGITNFKATINKQEDLTLTDHYGTAYTIMIMLSGMNSLTPKWDGAENEIHYAVEMMGV